MKIHSNDPGAEFFVVCDYETGKVLPWLDWADDEAGEYETWIWKNNKLKRDNTGFVSSEIIKKKIKIIDIRNIDEIEEGLKMWGKEFKPLSREQIKERIDGICKETVN